MNDRWILREARVADAAALFEAQRASVLSQCAALYSPLQMASWFEGRSPEMYGPALAKGKVWLAEPKPAGEGADGADGVEAAEGQAAAARRFGDRGTPERPPVMGLVAFEPGEITLLFVRPEAAGAGLGSRLLSLGMAHAQQGFTGPLSVQATLNAVGFYRRHGFVPVAEETIFRGLAQVPVAVVRMRRPLQAAAPL